MGRHDVPAAPERGALFGAGGKGIAYVAGAGTQSRVVHDGRPGRTYEAIEELVLSPDGRRIAYLALAGGKWRVVRDTAEGASFDEIHDLAISPTGARVAYVARAGGDWHLVVDSVVGAASARPFRSPVFDATASRIAFIEGADDAGWGRLVVRDLATGKQTVADERVSGIVLNEARSRVAAVSATGAGMRAVAFDFGKPELPWRGPEQDDVQQLTFGGDTLAYEATRAGRSYVVLDGREEALPKGERPVTPPVIRPDRGGLGVFVLSGGAVVLRECFAGGGAREEGHEAAYDLAYSPDGRKHAYAARRGGRWFLVVNGKEGIPFDRVITPAFSPDGKLVAVRARAAGRRFVVVADSEGRTISMHKGYDQVYPVKFAPDGKSVLYGVKEGAEFAWKVEAL